MILLLPLYRFLVEYEVASGRPYSELHRLTLHTIADSEDVTLNMLHEIFGLPSRILIEVLISLFKQGWIAISARTGGGFCVTPQGREALKYNKRPEMRVVEPKAMALIMERFTGMLALQNEIEFEPRYRLMENGIWQSSYHIEPQYNSGHLDEGQARSLLRVDSRQWIRHTNTPILTHDSYHLPVDVDLRPHESEFEYVSVTGLPARWRPHLEPLLLELAKDKARTNYALAGGTYWKDRHPKRTAELTSESWSIALAADDLLDTHETHIEELRRAFAVAKSTILISSSMINSSVMNTVFMEVLPSLKGRPVQVDLLCARQSTSATLSSFAETVLSLLEKEQVSITSTNSNANLLIYDTEDGYHACVGSYDWLGSSLEKTTGDHTRSLTIKLQHPGIIGDVSLSIAAFIDEAQPQHMLSSSADRWRRVSEMQAGEGARLAPDPAPEDQVGTEVCQVRVIRDQQHAALMSEYFRLAKRRVAIVSTGTNEQTERLVSSLLRTREETEVRRQLVVLPPGKQPTLAALANVEELTNQPIHANAFVADATTAISSFNFLAPPNPSSGRVCDLGICIEGQMIADTVWDRLCRTV